MDDLPVLVVRPTPQRIGIRASMQDVQRLTGKSPARQLREISQLAQGPGRLSPREYYYFGLYDDRRFSPDEKRSFLGAQMQDEILRKCTRPHWWAVAHDKLVFHGLMQSYGYPVPKVSATLHSFRTLTGARSLHTRDDLQRYLRHDAVYPLFSKPVDGIRSVGSARLDAYDTATDEVTVYPRRCVTIPRLVDSIWPYADAGYLFQEVQRPAPEVQALCGDRLATVRIVVIVGSSRPEIFRAVWKVPAGGHVADNYWRPGNLLCGIELSSGRVTSAITGVGTERVRVDRHPDTNMSFEGLAVPQWGMLQQACLTAAATIPGISLQGWDVAPCVQGPVLVEVNICGDFTLPQLGNDRGLLDEQFQAYLDAHRFRSLSYRNQLKANVRSALSSTGKALKRSLRRSRPNNRA